MAMNQSAGETKAGKSAAKGSASKKAEPKKAAGLARKAAGPKLSEPQKAMLKKVQDHADPLGYRAEKKPENKTLETLFKHKLVKKGKKHAESGHYHSVISQAGQKFSTTGQAPSPSVPGALPDFAEPGASGLPSEIEGGDVRPPEGSIEAVIQAWSAQVPDEEWDTLPTDLSHNLDHYIYGTPKR
jgi:hypothetical protein